MEYKLIKETQLSSVLYYWLDENGIRITPYRIFENDARDDLSQFLESKIPQKIVIDSVKV